MKVFISWSGERSKVIAEALHDWLPSVIQTVQTWISDSDIQKGERWAARLAAELEQTKIGIICLTPDNLNSPWIIFEAGALSKTLVDTHVCPLLFELDSSDIQGPLTQFHHTKAEKEDVRKLVQTINEAQGDKAIPVKQVDTAFERGWPELDQLLKKVPDVQTKQKIKRTERDMIEEILELIRAQTRSTKRDSDEAMLKRIELLREEVKQVRQQQRRPQKSLIDVKDLD
jgi:hypothetical protein